MLPTMRTMQSFSWRIAAVLLPLAVIAACSPAVHDAPPAEAPVGDRIVQAGAPGNDGRVLAPGEATGVREARHTAADVEFMQAMILHHAQALEMAELVPDRTERADLRLLARRIELAQEDEIAMMQRWLEQRGEEVPEVEATHGGHHHHEHHAHDHGEMAGMLTPEQMARLADASGEEFERLFLEAMIFHHQGAIAMVAELFASPGAAQEAEIYEFASHVDSDQRVEIDRMRALLRADAASR